MPPRWLTTVLSLWLAGQPLPLSASGLTVDPSTVQVRVVEATQCPGGVCPLPQDSYPPGWHAGAGFGFEIGIRPPPQRRIVPPPAQGGPQITSIGSGVRVQLDGDPSRHHVLTCSHLDDYGRRPGAVEVLDVTSGVWQRATIVARGRQADLLLLLVEGSTQPRRRIRRQADPDPGASLAVEAFVGGHAKRHGMTYLGGGDVSAEFELGESGGPVVDVRGRLVGLVTSRDAHSHRGHIVTLAAIVAFLDGAVPGWDAWADPPAPQVSPREAEVPDAPQAAAPELPAPVETPAEIPPAAAEPVATVAGRLGAVSLSVAELALMAALGGSTGGAGFLIARGVAGLLRRRRWRSRETPETSAGPRATPAAAQEPTGRTSRPPAGAVVCPLAPGSVLPSGAAIPTNHESPPASPSVPAAGSVPRTGGAADTPFQATNFAPYPVDKISRAYTYAKRELAAMYPGTVDTLQTLDALMQQYLSGEQAAKL